MNVRLTNVEPFSPGRLLGTYPADGPAFFVPACGGRSFSELDITGHAVPEPSSVVALCGLGAMGLFLAVRRRRKG
jgi:hypothetical protein